MSWASSEVVGVLTFLLPGFVAAAIFYSLTSHPKPGAFDRVIQALIFTVIGQAIVALLLAIDSTVKEAIQGISNSEFIVSVLGEPSGATLPVLYLSPFRQSTRTASNASR